MSFILQDEETLSFASLQGFQRQTNPLELMTWNTKLRLNTG